MIFLLLRTQTTDRQTDRQTYRQTDTHTEGHLIITESAQATQSTQKEFMIVQNF